MRKAKGRIIAAAGVATGFDGINRPIVGAIGYKVRKKQKRDARRRPFLTWSGRRVSNSRPIPWQGIALPTELLPQNLLLQATGGASRSRTDLHGFAIRCITALLSRQNQTFRVVRTTWAKTPIFTQKPGAGEESRTLDLYLGKVSLYQLSYSRVQRGAHYKDWRGDVNIRPCLRPKYPFGMKTETRPGQRPCWRASWRRISGQAMRM